MRSKSDDRFQWRFFVWLYGFSKLWKFDSKILRIWKKKSSKNEHKSKGVGWARTCVRPTSPLALPPPRPQCRSTRSVSGCSSTPSDRCWQPDSFLVKRGDGLHNNQLSMWCMIVKEYAILFFKLRHFYWGIKLCLWFRNKGSWKNSDHFSRKQFIHCLAFLRSVAALFLFTSLQTHVFALFQMKHNRNPTFTPVYHKASK